MWNWDLTHCRNFISTCFHMPLDSCIREMHKKAIFNYQKIPIAWNSSSPNIRNCFCSSSHWFLKRGDLAEEGRCLRNSLLSKASNPKGKIDWKTRRKSFVQWRIKWKLWNIGTNLSSKFRIHFLGGKLPSYSSAYRVLFVVLLNDTFLNSLQLW